MKILINALSGNGDALMFSPSLKILKEKFPDAEIDMLVMFRSVGEMYANSSYLNRIHFINFLRQSKLRSLREVRKLKENEYDYSINVYPANRLEYNLLNALLGAKKKLAHHYLHTEFTRGEFLNDVLVNEVKDRHNVLQNLDLVKTMTNVNDEDAGGLEIHVGDEDKSKALQWMRDNGLEGKLLIGFHPGSSVLKNHIHKRWDKNKYAVLGNVLMKEYDATILLFGNEFDLNNEINAMMENKGIISSTDHYMDSIARMEHCKLFISNDTAFMHSAAALKIPTVGIFGYTNAKELYPWKTVHEIVRIDLPCSPCFYNSPRPATCIFTGDEEFKCMKMISVDDVLKAVEKIQSTKDESFPSNIF